MRGWLCAVLVLAAATGLQGCKLVKNDPALAKGSSDPYASSYDPNTAVASMWSTKVVPDIEKRATAYATLRDAVTSDPDAAGKKYGYRGKDDGAPWNFPTRLHGTVVSVDTSSSEGTIGVDTSGSGKADVIVDIGPTVLGTALRDSLDFVSFSDFKNQIDYARFGTALNAYAVTHVMTPVPRNGLQGKQITVTGTFSFDGTSDQPEVVPVVIVLGDKS
jgi:predicted lipoprotein